MAISSPRHITSKGQVTLPVSWRNKVQSSMVVFKEVNGVLEVHPVRTTSRGDVILFNADRDTNGTGIQAKELLRALKNMK